MAQPEKETLLQRLRTRQVNWYVVIAVVAVMAALFVFGLRRNDAELRRLLTREAELQETLAQKEHQNLALQREIDTVGSMGYIEVHARSDHGYLKPGEIRFEIENADQLGAYTKEEWAIRSEEMLFSN